jgi:hypothetical protein
LPTHVKITLAHIQTHLTFALDPTLGSNRLIAPKFIPQVMEHIKQHMMLWYTSQMTGYVTAGTNIKLGAYEDSKLAPEIDKAMAIASDHVKLDTAEVFKGVLPALQQLGQVSCNSSNHQHLLWTEKRRLCCRLLWQRLSDEPHKIKRPTNSRRKKCKRVWNAKTKICQARIAMNAENNLTKERMMTADLTVEELRLQKEQEKTALKLQNVTQRNLGE